MAFLIEKLDELFERFPILLGVFFILLMIAVITVAGWIGWLAGEVVGWLWVVARTHWFGTIIVIALGSILLTHEDDRKTEPL